MSLNRYSYVANSPLNYTDPSGHRAVQESMLSALENSNAISCNAGVLDSGTWQTVVELLKEIWAAVKSLGPGYATGTAGAVSPYLIVGDGPLPVGDIIAGGLIAVALVIDNADAIYAVITKAGEVVYYTAAGIFDSLAEAIAGTSEGGSDAAYADAAITARDEELERICALSNNQKRKYVAVAAGYNKNTGQVAVGAKIEEAGMRTYCAEDMVVAQLIALGASLDDIVMTPAIRPRTMEIIPVCKFCQQKYSRDNFIPGTPFE